MADARFGAVGPAKFPTAYLRLDVEEAAGGRIRAQEEWASCRRLAEDAELPRSVSLDAIVRHYIRHHRRRAKTEIAYYAAMPSVPEAVRRAGRAERPGGKRHDHQTRVGPAAIHRAAQTIAQLNVRRCKNFEELHELIAKSIGPQPGIGELMVYDTARVVPPNATCLSREIRGTRRRLTQCGGLRPVDPVGPIAVQDAQVRRLGSGSVLSHDYLTLP